MAKSKNAHRADGRIQVRVYLGKDESGKKLYKSVFGRTQKEADEKADEIRLLMKKGLNIIGADTPFRDISARWLKLKLQNVRSGEYTPAVRQINEYIGDMPLSKIKPMDIQLMIDELAECNPNTGKPAAKKTLIMRRLTVKQIFDMAIENRIVDFNPAAYVKIPASAPKATRRALTEEEQGWILNTEHRAKTAAMLMMYAGLRRGELIPLMWSDIDFADGSVSVNKSVYRTSNKFYVKKGAKTAAGTRVIYPPRILMDYLRSLPRDSVYVCPAASGGMHTESSWTSMWNSYLAELNLKYGSFSGGAGSKYDPHGVPFVIPRITPHWLRHTCATLLYFAGYDIKDAMEYLGHSDMSVTLQIYTHLDAKYKKRTARKFDDYLKSRENA